MREGQKMSETAKEKSRKSNIVTWANPEIRNKILGENNGEARLSSEEVIFIFHHAKLYENHIKKYSRYVKYDGYTYTALAKMFNVSRTSIRHILIKKLWSHLTNNL